MRVVVVSKHNYAGSAYYTKEALNFMGHEARLITLKRGNDKFNLPQDIVLMDEIEKRKSQLEPPRRAMGVLERIRNNKLRAAMNRHDLSDLQQLLNDADVIHFKGDDLPSVDYLSPLKIPKNKAWLFEAGGSNFRRSGLVDKISHPLAAIDRYRQVTDKMCAVTADLCYDEIDWLPHAFDVYNQALSWEQVDKPVIMAIPSHAVKKGIPQYFMPAMEILREKGYDFELVMPDKQMSQAESIALKKKATIYFDQVAIGWYSRSAVEAMSLGVPVVFWLSEEAKAQNNLWGELSVNDKKLLSMYDEPVPSAEGLAAAFAKLLDRPKGFPHLATLSRWSRQYAEKMHAYDNVVMRLNGYYEEALSEKKNG